jgi:hypothetical protein
MRRTPMIVTDRSILDWGMSLCQVQRRRREALPACPYRERRATVDTTSCPWTWHYPAPICYPRSCMNLASLFTPSQGLSTTKRIRIGLSPNSTMLHPFDRSLKVSMLDLRILLPVMHTATRPRDSKITQQPTSSLTQRRCLQAPLQ